MTNCTQNFRQNQTLPPHVQSLIGPVPRSGDGVHRWLFISALKLHCRFSPEEVFLTLREAVSECDRLVPDREISDAVKNSAGIKSGVSLSSSSNNGYKRWPEVDHLAVHRIVSSCCTPLERLSAASDHLGLQPGSSNFVWTILSLLFPGDPLLCAGGCVKSMQCHHLSEWQSTLSSTQLIVPSPMTARTGVNQDGKASTRCLGNTGSRRFLVIEFDNATITNQAALHIHLAARYPLAMVVHSAGKSLHGWYFVDGEPEDNAMSFMRYAATLGADPHTWTRCQAVRTPGGIRRDGGQMLRQQVLFLNLNHAG